MHLELGAVVEVPFPHAYPEHRAQFRRITTEYSGPSGADPTPRPRRTVNAPQESVSWVLNACFLASPAPPVGRAYMPQMYLCSCTRIVHHFFALLGSCHYRPMAPITWQDKAEFITLKLEPWYFEAVPPDQAYLLCDSDNKGTRYIKRRVVTILSSFAVAAYADVDHDNLKQGEACWRLFTRIWMPLVITFMTAWRWEATGGKASTNLAPSLLRRCEMGILISTMLIQTRFTVAKRFKEQSFTVTCRSKHSATFTKEG